MKNIYITSLIKSKACKIVHYEHEALFHSNQYSVKRSPMFKHFLRCCWTLKVFLLQYIWNILILHLVTDINMSYIVSVIFFLQEGVCYVVHFQFLTCIVRYTILVEKQTDWPDLPIITVAVIGNECIDWCNSNYWYHMIVTQMTL